MDKVIKRIEDAVNKYRRGIIDVAEFMWDNPECGYREWRATKYLEEKYEALGYKLVCAGNIPGFYTVIDTGRPGPEILVLGELDALSCPGHFHADPQTGMAHACGHNAQSAALYGIAAALTEDGMLDGLSGRIRLCAVPAEEIGELEFREELKKEGVITYFAGKAEFMHRGFFNGVDMAILVHTQSASYYSVDGGAVGLLSKRATFKGVSAHAGTSPSEGRNALYAATQGLSAINALRETFRDDDHIRVHPIITEGGGAVNTIPDRVTLESYVRGLTVEAIADANRRINRALAGAAVSLGVELEISDTLSAAPMTDSPKLAEVAGEAIKMMLPDAEYHFFNKPMTGSTDMGDVSAIMPTVHAYIPGVEGKGHGIDYRIADHDIACLMSAKWQIAMLHILLSDGARRAYDVLDGFTPRFASAKELLDFKMELSREGDRVFYSDGGEITVKV